jgi:hypothetical protein
MGARIQGITSSECDALLGESVWVTTGGDEDRMLDGALPMRAWGRRFLPEKQKRRTAWRYGVEAVLRVQEH